MRAKFAIASSLILITIILLAQYWPPAWWSLVVFAPLILLGAYDMVQRQHTLIRNFPIFGRGAT